MELNAKVTRWKYKKAKIFSVVICDKEFYIIYCLGDIASISLIELLQALLIDVLFKSYIDS